MAFSLVTQANISGIHDEEKLNSFRSKIFGQLRRVSDQVESKSLLAKSMKQLSPKSSIPKATCNGSLVNLEINLEDMSTDKSQPSPIQIQEELSRLYVMEAAFQATVNYL